MLHAYVYCAESAGPGSEGSPPGTWQDVSSRRAAVPLGAHQDGHVVPVQQYCVQVSLPAALGRDVAEQGCQARRARGLSPLPPALHAQPLHALFDYVFQHHVHVHVKACRARAQPRVREREKRASRGVAPRSVPTSSLSPFIITCGSDR